MRQLISLTLDERKERFQLTLDIDGQLHQFTVRVDHVNMKGTIIRLFVYEQEERLITLLEPKYCTPKWNIRAALSTMYKTGSVDLPLDLDQD